MNQAVKWLRGAYIEGTDSIIELLNRATSLLEQRNAAIHSTVTMAVFGDERLRVRDQGRGVEQFSTKDIERLADDIRELNDEILDLESNSELVRRFADDGIYKSYSAI